MNSSRQLGGTLGLAVLVSIATTTTRSSKAQTPVQALSEGYSLGLGVGAVLLAVGAVLAYAILPRRPADLSVSDSLGPRTSGTRQEGDR